MFQTTNQITYSEHVWNHPHVLPHSLQLQSREDWGQIWPKQFPQPAFGPNGRTFDHPWPSCAPAHPVSECDWRMISPSASPKNKKGQAHHRSLEMDGHHWSPTWYGSSLVFNNGDTNCSASWVTCDDLHLHDRQGDPRNCSRIGEPPISTHFSIPTPERLNHWRSFPFKYSMTKNMNPEVAMHQAKASQRTGWAVPPSQFYHLVPSISTSIYGVLKPLQMRFLEVYSWASLSHKLTCSALWGAFSSVAKHLPFS